MAPAQAEDLLLLAVTFLLAATVTISVLVWGRREESLTRGSEPHPVRGAHHQWQPNR